MGVVLEMLANALWPLLFEGRARWVSIPTITVLFVVGMYYCLQAIL